MPDELPSMIEVQQDTINLTNDNFGNDVSNDLLELGNDT